MGIFSAVTVLLWFRLPANTPRKPQGTGATGSESPRDGSSGALACLRNRRFVLFCLLASTNILAYNQLYFAVPLELGRRGLDDSWLAMLFLLASVLTLVLQLPVSAAGHRLGPDRALSVGFVLLGAAFVAAALTSGHAGSSGNSVVPLAGTIALLILGHMLITPTILSLIPKFLPADLPGGRARVRAGCLLRIGGKLRRYLRAGGQCGDGAVAGPDRSAQLVARYPVGAARAARFPGGAGITSGPAGKHTACPRP